MRFEVAEQRGACWSLRSGFMRLMLDFFMLPPSSCLQSAADDGLPAVVDIDVLVLNLDALFSSRAIFLQRLDLSREC